jgi:peroxin-19
MKDVCNMYPEWLQKNKSKQSKEAMEKFERQYECFKRIVFVLEQEESPANKEKLLSLMSEMQQYGPPPQELVGDILPFGPGNGALPQMPQMPAGLFGGNGMPTPEQMQEIEKNMQQAGCPTQ